MKNQRKSRLIDRLSHTVSHYQSKNIFIKSMKLSKTKLISHNNIAIQRDISLSLDSYIIFFFGIFISDFVNFIRSFSAEFHRISDFLFKFCNLASFFSQFSFLLLYFSFLTSLLLPFLSCLSFIFSSFLCSWFFYLTEIFPRIFFLIHSILH